MADNKQSSLTQQSGMQVLNSIFLLSSICLFLGVNLTNAFDLSLLRNLAAVKI